MKHGLLTRSVAISRKPASRLWLAALIAIVVVGSAQHRVAVAQQSPVMRIKETVEIDRRGDARCAVVVKLPAGLYTELKKNSPNMAVLLRRMGLFQSWHEVRDVSGDFDDNASSFTIHWNTRGMARIVRDNVWEAPVGGEGSLELVSLRDNEVLFTAAQETRLGLCSGVVQVTLPAGTKDVRAVKDPDRIAFRVPVDAADGSKTEVKVRMQVRPQIMMCLAKVYGDPKFASYWAARCVLENAGDQCIKEYRVRFRVADYTSAWSAWSKTERIVPGQTVTDAYFPVFDLEKVGKLNGPRPAVVELEYEYVRADGQRVKESDSQQIQLLGRNQVLYSSLAEDQVVDFYDRYDSGPAILAAFVTKDDPVIQQMAGWVSGQAGGAAAAANDEAAIRYLKALYDFMASNKIAYQTPPGARINGQFSQHVKYGRDVLQNRAGTCIDLAILFGSGCEAVGLKPVLFLVPGHCFAGIMLPRSGKIVAVETTMVGQADFGQAIKVGSEEAAKAMQKQMPSFQVDIMQMREQGVYSLELPAVPASVLKDWGIVPGTSKEDAQAAPQGDGRGNAGGEVPSIVGKWTATMVFNGTRLTSVSLLKPDGTVAMVIVNAAGQVLKKDTGRYVYANGVLSAQYESGTWEKASITWVNPNQVLYKVLAGSDPSAVGVQIQCRRLEQ